MIGQCIQEALAELVDTTSETRMRAPRGRYQDGSVPRSGDSS